MLTSHVKLLYTFLTVTNQQGKDMSLITDSRAADLLCSAFEGGSNYWYLIDHKQVPVVAATPWGNEYMPSYISYPFSQSGAIVIVDIEDPDGDKHTLNKAAIERGKTLLSTDDQYGHHLENVLQEQDDADTGDIFLQLCLFGEVIYG